MTVTDYTGGTHTCYHNKYGMHRYSYHGGGYPATNDDGTGGGCSVNNWCMFVGVMADGGSANGFTSNNNGNDAPKDDNDWPNAQFDQPNHLSVWLK